MAPGRSAAWPAGSPCTAGPRLASTAPPAPTTANPLSPSAGAGRPDTRSTSGPGAAARPRTPPVDGRAAHRQPHHTNHQEPPCPTPPLPHRPNPAHEGIADGPPPHDAAHHAAAAGAVA